MRLWRLRDRREDTRNQQKRIRAEIRNLMFSPSEFEQIFISIFCMLRISMTVDKNCNRKGANTKNFIFLKLAVEQTKICTLFKLLCHELQRANNDNFPEGNPNRT